MFLKKLFRRRAGTLKAFIKLASNGYREILVQPRAVFKDILPHTEFRYWVRVTATGYHKRLLVYAEELGHLRHEGSDGRSIDFSERHIARVRQGLRTEELVEKLTDAVPNATVRFVDSYGNVVEDPKPSFTELHRWAKTYGVAV